MLRNLSTAITINVQQAIAAVRSLKGEIERVKGEVPKVQGAANKAVAQVQKTSTTASKALQQATRVSTTGLTQVGKKAEEAKRHLERNRDATQRASRAQRELGERSKDLGRNWGQLALQLAALTAGLLYFTHKANEAALNVERIEATFEAVFGGLAPRVEAWAAEFAARQGYGLNTVKDALAEVQALFISAGLASSQAAKMAEDWIMVAERIAARSHLPLGEVLNTMQRAVSGFTRGLVRLGVNISTQLLNQVAAEMYGRRYTELSESSRMRVLTEAMKRSSAYMQEQAEKVLATNYGALRRLREQWGDFMEEVGATTLPITAKFYNALAAVLDKLKRIKPLTGAIGIFVQLGGAISAVASSVATFGMAIFGLKQMGMWDPLVRGIRPLRTLIRWLGRGTLAVVRFGLRFAATTAMMVARAAAWLVVKGAVLAYSLALKAASVAQVAFNAVLTANPIGVIIMAIAAAVAGLVAFGLWISRIVHRMGGFRAAMSQVGAALKRFGESIWRGLVSLVQRVPEIAHAIGDFLKGVATSIWRWIQRTANHGIRIFLATMHSMLRWVPWLGEKIENALLSFDPLVLFIRQLRESEPDLAAEMERIAQIVRDAHPELHGKELIEAFLQEVRESKPEVADAVEEMIEPLRERLEAHSPPKVGPLRYIERWGERLAESYSRGLLSGMSSLQGAVTRMAALVASGALSVASIATAAGAAPAVHPEAGPAQEIIRATEVIREHTERVQETRVLERVPVTVPERIERIVERIPTPAPIERIIERVQAVPFPERVERLVERTQEVVLPEVLGWPPTTGPLEGLGPGFIKRGGLRRAPQITIHVDIGDVIVQAGEGVRPATARAVGAEISSVLAEKITEEVMRRLTTELAAAEDLLMPDEIE